MTEENKKLLSLDVAYFIMIMLMTLCFLDAKNVFDLLFLAVTTFYYIRVKIYRWKKYH
ncbi:MAG: hypothetical protein IJE53_05270 [Bacilli bacterium]|nr:hypothetical protein [Bacilli bacterium]